MRHPWNAIARLLSSGRRRATSLGRRGVMGLAFAAASLVAIPSVHALLIVPQFYDGLWNCTLDGRDVRISWQRNTISRSVCRPSGCMDVPDIATVGWFEETQRGGDWVRFGSFRQETDWLITFRHPDGNRWRLEDIRPGVMRGSSTWRGRSFPLSCERVAGDPEARRFTEHPRPRVGNRRLDWCRVWGRECGMDAADEWCRDDGAWKAVRVRKAENIGAATPTRVISGGQVCNRAFCDGFENVTCQR